MIRRPWICPRCLSRRALRVLNTRLRPYSQATPLPRANTIYPALISRARALADEHKTLSHQLHDKFTVDAAKKAGELSSVVEALRQWDKANESLSELQCLINDPTTDPELRGLATEDLETTVSQLNRASKTLSTSLVPKHPFAQLPCLIEIRPGAGGSEANLFAYDLYNMYKNYCTENSLRFSVLEEELADGRGDGLVEAILSVETLSSYGRLRCEAGVHRVQRVPETETKGRTHTSAAAVMVLPSFPDDGGGDDNVDFNDPNSDYYIDPTEVRIDVMRASGAGGQHVNRTESAVRLTHIPTNTVVACQNGRSQLANRKTAWSILRARLAQSRREAREEEVLAMRRSVVGVAKVGRGDKIRTYNWAQQRITDHRSGVSVHGIDGVMAGGMNLEKLMVSVREWMAEKEIEGMILAGEDEEGRKPLPK